MEKSLGEVDYQFLSASQEVDKQAVRERAQILEAANLKARWLIRRGKVILGVMVALALAAGGIAIWNTNLAKIAETDKEALERDMGKLLNKRNSLQKENKVLLAENKKINNANREINRELTSAKQEEEKASKEVKKVSEQLEISSRKLNEAESQASEALQRADLAEKNITQLAQSQENIEQELNKRILLLDDVTRKLEDAKRTADFAQKGIQLEQTGVAIINQFRIGGAVAEELLETSAFTRESEIEKNIQILISAVIAGKELEKLIDKLTFSEYPTTSPILALQIILNELQSQERVEKKMGQEIPLNSATTFNANASYIALAEPNGNVTLLGEGDQEFRSFRTYSPLSSISFWNDNHLITGDLNGIIEIWDQAGELQGEHVTSEDRGLVVDISVVPNTQTVAIAYGNGEIRLLELPANQEYTLRSKGQTLIRDIFVSPRGNYLAAADLEGVIFIWNLQNLEQEALRFDSYQDRVRKVVLDPDDQVVATLGFDGSMKIWSFTGMQVAEFNPNNNIIDVTFSLNKKLFFLERDGTLKSHHIEGLSSLLKRSCDWLSGYANQYREVLDICS